MSDAEGGDIVPNTVSCPSAEEWLSQFDEYLRDVRGARAGTRQVYERHVRAFLGTRLVRITACDVRGLTPAEIMAFVKDQAAQGSPGRMKTVLPALRCFLRYLVMCGICDASLVSSVPTVPRPRLATLPKVLSEIQVDALLRSFDRTTVTGQRDYAMALCLVRLGLRAGEVAALSLDDVDWRSQTIQLRTDKERRVSVLPLPGDVAAALAAHLQNGRPSVENRQLFVQRPHGRSPGAPLSGAAVRRTIARAWRRSGVHVPSRGTHALRYTLASRLLAAGSDLKHIADILRHRDLDTTMIYAKVDWEHLAEVIQPWPVMVQ